MYQSFNPSRSYFPLFAVEFGQIISRTCFIVLLMIITAQMKNPSLEYYTSDKCEETILTCFVEYHAYSSNFQKLKKSVKPAARSRYRIFPVLSEFPIVPYSHYTPKLNNMMTFIIIDLLLKMQYT